MFPRQKAKELIEKFKPHTYCFIGSGMLTNSYDERIALLEAQKCAQICVKEIVESIPMKPELNTEEHDINMHSEDFWSDVDYWLHKEINEIFEENGSL